MSHNRPFPTSATLTAIAIAYQNPDAALIHTRALPAIPVLSEKFTWQEFPLAQSFTVPELEVGRRGRVGRIEFKAEERDSSTKDYGQDSEIPYSDIREAAAARAAKLTTYDPRAAATAQLTNLVKLGREVRCAQVVQNPANYSADRKIVLANANDKFSKYDTSDPFGVISEGFDKTLVYRPNHIIMGQPVWSKIRGHPRLIKAVKGGLTEDGAITKAQFAELFEIPVENLLIGQAQVNLAKRGHDPLLARVWGKSIQLLYLDRSKQASTDGVMTWGFTAEYGTPIAGSIEDKDIGLEGGERVRVGEK
ncbi:MAG: capsid protein, partial [Bauldia sp.]